MQANASRWIFVAIVYFVMAVGLGVFMGASHDHSLMSVHVHLNLLGWVSLALIGVIYHFFPRAGESRVATVQFWLHNVALPPMMLALAFLLKGNAGVEPVVAITSLAILVSALLFAVNVLGKRA
ncbi:MAG: hypothetical protein ACRERR_02175 [Moraxellaceae bacterium]